MFVVDHHKCVSSGRGTLHDFQIITRSGGAPVFQDGLRFGHDQTIRSLVSVRNPFVCVRGVTIDLGRKLGPDCNDHDRQDSGLDHRSEMDDGGG